MDKKQESEVNKKTILFIIFSLVIVIITGTFAWLSWRSQNTAMTFKVGDIRGLEVTLTPYQINATLSPVSTYTDGIVVNVTASNNKAEADNFKLFYKINTIDTELIDSGFKYTITKCTSNCDNDSNYQVLNDASGDFSSASANSNLKIYQEAVPANTTYKYKVYLWIDSSAGNQSNMQNKIFIGELRASIEAQSLYDTIAANAVMDNISSDYVTNANGVQFNAVSSDTNGKGSYIRAGTENDTHPIYYYRGAVTDNNVLFANFCWKIVRTTSTGGIKVIYSGLPTNGECNNTGANLILASSSFNGVNDSLAYVGYMYGTVYMNGYDENGNNYIYGTGVNYQNGMYTLLNADSVANDYNTFLSTHHYTCLSTAASCQNVYYIYNNYYPRIYYVELTGGKNIAQALDEMLTNSSNTNDSVIKIAVDNWYATNLLRYANKLEDTVWCNDRTIYQLGAFDPAGGSTNVNYLYFGFYERDQSTNIPSLTCNTNDAFSVNTNIGNGKLMYPIGLLTADEITLAGTKYLKINRTFHLGTNSSSNYWLMTPLLVNEAAAVSNIQGTLGRIIANVTSLDTVGIRPAISLKNDIGYVLGDGSAANPYVIQ